MIFFRNHSTCTILDIPQREATSGLCKLTSELLQQPGVLLDRETAVQTAERTADDCGLGCDFS